MENKECYNCKYFGKVFYNIAKDYLLLRKPYGYLPGMDSNIIFGNKTFGEENKEDKESHTVCNFHKIILPENQAHKCNNFRKENMENWEKKALEFASKIHYGNKDDAGRPYMSAHILPVVAILKQITKDEEIITAAYLHDTIEDGDTTYNEIKNIFGKNIADIVNEVTKEGPSKNDYFPRLHSKKAIILKFADRLQNLSRMEPAWNEARQQRYMNRSKFWREK